MSAQPMTGDQFARAKALDAQATAGPWFARISRYQGKEWRDLPPFLASILAHSSDQYALECEQIVETDAGHYPPKIADGEFIADARTSLPAALAWIEQALPLLQALPVYDYNVRPTEEFKRIARALTAGFDFDAGFPEQP